MPGTESPLNDDALAALGQARTLFETWRERWQAASGQGYSATDEALVDVDRLLQGLEGVRRRWRDDVDVPAAHAETYARYAEALDNLCLRLEELLTALDNQDLERLRVCAQAVELSGQRLGEGLPG